jgi:hypothetical protein
MKKAYLGALLWFVLNAAALAGPPFLTDDPVPVGYHQSEIYLFSSGTRDAAGNSGVGPAVEFNYGILPDCMVHLITTLAYDNPKDEPSNFGYGDTEIGIKYRLVHETDIRPMIGVFPLIEIPTGDSEKGLGSSQAQYFLPIWLQKDFHNWTTYGGGGYWINPGTGNKNYWFTGILLQYAFFESFYLGGEIFYQTAETDDGDASSGFNFGGGLPLIGNVQLLFSAGSGVKNNATNDFSYYLGLYLAF